jgi:opacity protein-like surface antigen
MKARVLLVAALVCIGRSAMAQERPVKLNLGGGVSLTHGDFSDAQSPGWHALVGLDLTSPDQPLGFRLDGMYNSFTARSSGPDEKLTSATANATYSFPMIASPVTPYVIGGAGAYHRECKDITCVSKTKFGWNAGAGVKGDVVGAGWFAEARFNSVNGGLVGNSRFTTLTLGLTL